MDLFTVLTLTFGVLPCSFVISHDRRLIVHREVTRDPSGAWGVHQLREVFPYNSSPRYLIFDLPQNCTEFRTTLPILLPDGILARHYR
jgi:hypothetical protein